MRSLNLWLMSDSGSFDCDSFQYVRVSVGLSGGWVRVVWCLQSCTRFPILAGVSNGMEASMN